MCSAFKGVPNSKYKIRQRYIQSRDIKKPLIPVSTDTLIQGCGAGTEEISDGGAGAGA